MNHCVLAVIGCLMFGATTRGGEPDFTKPNLKDLGVEFVKPKKDEKTGFVVAGKNETAVIRKLTEINERKIADLEKDMRPGAKSEVGSTKGYLGKDEKLLDIMAEDNDFVLGKLQQTHQELAKHLHIVGAIAKKHAKAGDEKEGFTFQYHGRRYKVTYIAFRGIAHSPFYDGTKTNIEATLINLTTDAKLKYSLLVPHLIERYGFYEGRGTPYRVDPRDIVAVFDFLAPKKNP